MHIIILHLVQLLQLFLTYLQLNTRFLMLSFPSSYSLRMLEATLYSRGTLTEWGLGPPASVWPVPSLVSPLMFCFTVTRL